MIKTPTKTFNVSHRSDVDDTTYTGVFITKKLSIGDWSKLGAIKAQLAGGFSYDAKTGRGVDEPTDFMNEMIAHCQLALVQKPDWFDLDQISDMEVLNAVYREVAAFENSFRTKRAGNPVAEPAGSEGVSRQSPGTGAPEHIDARGPVRDIQALVDRKIPQIVQVE